MGGKYVAYPEYKKTGVSWLPVMPQGWQVTKLKYLISTLESGVSVNAADYSKSEGEFGVLKTSCVYTRKFRCEENKTVLVEEIARVKCPVKSGSIIISRMNTPDLVGAAAYVDADYKDLYLPDRLWQTVYKDDAVQSSKYVHFFMYLRGFRDRISAYAEGASSSMQNIAKEDFLSINILLPSRYEQQKIANFLDHETAKIDTLIEKQQQLIKLLKEKRQAVISHAVTKGLNPNAPMRDSGVEWLGEVPEHWEVAKLKHVVSEPLMYGANEAALDVSHDNPRFVRITDVKEDGTLKYDTFRSLSEELAEPYLLDEGDILLARTGGTVGKSFMYSESWGRCCFAGYLIKASLDQSKVKAEWLYQYTQTQYYWEWIASSQIQATLPNVSADKYNGFLMAVPPADEQVEILKKNRLDVVRFKELILKTQNAIELMQERRTALISAAVTGKIDVRNFTPENDQPSNSSQNKKETNKDVAP